MSNTLKILIVEDQTMVALDLEEQLLNLGYSITDNVRNSDDALRAFRKRIPDIIILDITLEGSKLDGIEIAQEFNKICRVPIIYLTAYTNKEFKERAKTTKPGYYLVKPCNPYQLEVAIEFSIENFHQNKEASLSHSLEFHEMKKNSFFLQQDYFFVKSTSNSFVRINIEDLLYVKAEGTMVNIITVQNKVLFSVNLKSFQTQINYPTLIRVHNSYVVNISKIKKIEDNYLVFNKKETPPIPIGKTYRDSLFTSLKRLRAN